MKYILPFLLFLAACSSQKHITTQQTHIDSLSTHVKDSFNAVINKLTASYEKKLVDARKTNVVFKEVRCPTLPKIDSSCNKDSIVAAYNRLAAYAATLKNTVKINADGSAEYEGQIASVSLDLEKTQQELSKVSQENSYLSHVRDSLSTELLLVKSAKQVDKKSSFLSGIGFIIALALIAFVIGIIIGYKFKNK
jgi:hypothetical protein